MSHTHCFFSAAYREFQNYMIMHEFLSERSEWKNSYEGKNSYVWLIFILRVYIGKTSLAKKHGF